MFSSVCQHLFFTSLLIISIDLKDAQSLLLLPKTVVVAVAVVVVAVVSFSLVTIFFVHSLIDIIGYQGGRGGGGGGGYEGGGNDSKFSGLRPLKLRTMLNSP